MDIVQGKTTWIDIKNPTEADIDHIKKIHAFHPIILDELLHVSARGKVEHYDSYLYLSYHFPIYDHQLRTSRRAEIDFLITKNVVITIRYEDLEPIANFKNNLSGNQKLMEQILGGSGYVTYYLLQEINDFCLRQLRHIEHNVTSVTKDLFGHEEYQMLHRVSYIKRDILDYGVIVKPQALLLQSLKEVGIKFWGEALTIYLSDLIGDNLKIAQQLENFKDAIESVEETNGQLLNAKTNAVMQRFTILAFLTFPLTLFTTIFGVDIVTKEITDPKIFWGGFALVLIVTVTAIIIFRKTGLLRE